MQVQLSYNPVRIAWADENGSLSFRGANPVGQVFAHEGTARKALHEAKEGMSEDDSRRTYVLVPAEVKA